MLLSTDFASDRDLLDRVMDGGIVVEVCDRLGLSTLDIKKMHVSVAALQLFDTGNKAAFRLGYFSKKDDHS